jgi:hypothetical protein
MLTHAGLAAGWRPGLTATCSDAEPAVIPTLRFVLVFPAVPGGEPNIFLLSVLAGN